VKQILYINKDGCRRGTRGVMVIVEHRHQNCWNAFKWRSMKEDAKTSDVSHSLTFMKTRILEMDILFNRPCSLLL